MVFGNPAYRILILFYISGGIVVAVAHIYPPVTAQRQALNIGRYAHFSLQ